MTRRVMGTFNGTAAGVYLELGFIPDYFRITDVEVATNPNFIEWNRSFVGAATYGGVSMTGADGQYTQLTTGGIFPYEGGKVLTSADQSVTYGLGSYLRCDDKNYQADYVFGSGTSGTPIKTWTLGNSGNRTGNWNVAKVASGAKIGIGSMISIFETSSGLVKEASITALTSDGEEANEVTLSRAIGSGSIVFISGIYQWAPSPIGSKTEAGVYIADSTLVNVSNSTIAFEASADD